MMSVGPHGRPKGWKSGPMLGFALDADSTLGRTAPHAGDVDDQSATGLARLVLLLHVLDHVPDTVADLGAIFDVALALDHERRASVAVAVEQPDVVVGL